MTEQELDEDFKPVPSTQLADANAFDLDAMIADDKAQAEKDYNAAKANETAQEDIFNNAKFMYRTLRKALRKEKFKCMRAISAGGYPTSSVSSNRNKTILDKCPYTLGGNLNSRNPDFKNTVCGKGWFASDKACARREARSLRNAARDRAKTAYKSAKQTWKDFQDNLKSLKFQADYLPVVMKLLKGPISKGLSEMNLASDTTEVAGDASSIDTKSISSQEVLKEFITLKLTNLVQTKLIGPMLELIKGVLWNAVDTLVTLIKDPLILSISSIPFVGPPLAFVIGKIIDKLYSAIQTKVDGVIDSLGEKILNAIVKSIVGALFPGNTYKPADAATLAAQANTQATSISATHWQKASLQAADAAAQAANGQVGLEDELKVGAEELSVSSADEEKIDTAEEEALQGSDDDEDNCEAEDSNACDDSSQGTYVHK